jgi:two-component system, NtrC family, response regulator AtoC
VVTGRSGRARILVVDDSESVRSYLVDVLEAQGYAVDTARDGESALALLDAGAGPDAILLDVMMPGIDGLETLNRVRERYPAIAVLMLSVVGKASTIVEAMRRGAVDYLTKPFEEEQLRAALERALGTVKAPAPEAVRGSFDEPYWHGPAMLEVRALLDQIADTDVTVLIQGESGVGKEIVARAVHESSTRRRGAFVKVNCAALPGTLLESELFGYERGAFTGALARKSGKFELASGGTIFLDEIGEMSPALQAKLLHVLQDGCFARLGGNHEIAVDARVLTATNRDLATLVARGGFREDLYFRINVVGVTVPPLRERTERAELVDYLLARASARYGKPKRALSARLLRAIERHPFPGNVRELENLLKRIVVLGSEESVLRDLLAGDQRRAGGASGSLERVLAEVEESAGRLPLREVARRAALEAERGAIERVLYASGWNRKRAAGRLGVSYKTLLQKIRECGLDPDS